MHLNDLIDKVLAILPEATFGEDNDNQLIIYTNLTLDEHENVIPFEED